MKNLTNEQFIEKARKIYGNKYDYSKVNYINSKTKVCIICPEHGEFWKVPSKHLCGEGCQICGYKNLRKLKQNTTEEFIKRAKEIHGDKYDYSKVEYVNNRTKVCIICPEHGEFWQTPNNHLQGYVCENNKRISTEKFIKRAKEIHGDKYDYSKVNYINASTKVCIICPEHGEFYQNPFSHLNGCGCPNCKKNSKLEDSLKNLLNEMKINFEYQKRFEWLGRQSLDFYLPDYNIAIECQGKQHFIEGCFNETLNEIKKRDKNKLEKCNKHKVKIFYVVNKNYNNIDETIYKDCLFNINSLKKLINQIIKKESEK